MRSKFSLTILFWLFCGTVFFLNDSARIILLRPQSIHVWRQTDCVSYALNYYQNSQPFFEPQTHTLIGKNGHAVSEFPILYYLTGKLYHIVGPKEWVLRSINFFLFLFGCTCLLWLGLEVLKNRWLAFIPAVVTFTSPYLYYYALNFLPDVPALSLALAGTFFLFRYFNTTRIGWAYLSATAFCLGGLLKISAGISVLAISGAVLLLFFTSQPMPILKKHYYHLIVLLLSILFINFGWIQFAKYYNSINETRQNLLGFLPIWDADKNDIIYIGQRFIEEWSKVILHPVSWLWLGMLLLFIILKWNLLGHFQKGTLFFMILGLIVYSLLWYQAYLHHDYYMINPFIAIIWILLSACIIADQIGEGFQKVFMVVACMNVFVSVYHSRYVQTTRYNDSKYNNLNKDLLTIEPYLRSIGISRNDRIVSVPDPSANITLYFMNQPGWTELFDESDYPFERSVDSMAKYLITSDTNFIKQPKYLAHTGKLVGTYKSFSIFAIKK